MSIASLADKFHASISQKYIESKQELKDTAEVARYASIACVVAALFVTVVGAGVGIILAIPLVYLGYNGYRFSNNLEVLADNPKELDLMAGITKIDRDKLLNVLKKDTIWFEPVIKYFMKMKLEKDLNLHE